MLCPDNPNLQVKYKKIRDIEGSSFQYRIKNLVRGFELEQYFESKFSILKKCKSCPGHKLIKQLKVFSSKHSHLCGGDKRFEKQCL